LFAALNSNKSGPVDTNALFTDPAMAASGFDNSPHEAPGSSTLTNLDESPFIDYEYDFDNDGLADGNFGDYDFSNMSQHQMIGAIPGTSSDGDNETHDKRSYPDDDENEDEGGGKRREGDEKSSKKPGRKPLTSEPTSVRHIHQVAIIILTDGFTEA
jgi:AP-1-like factor